MVISEDYWKGLEQQAAKTQNKAYASCTLENYRIQWALYFNFCMYFNRIALPAQSKTLVNYMQFLSIKMKALGTIRSYVAGIKTLHELLDIDTQAFDSIRVKLMTMGLQNTITHVTRRAAPISPEILADIRDTLDLKKSNDWAFWALCVTAFNILAQKSNLVPVKDFDPGKQLSRGNLVFGDNFVDVSLHWTKTRRPNEDPMVYPLYRIPGSKVCPFVALKEMCKRIPASNSAPCFMWEDGSPITYDNSWIDCGFP